MKCYFAASLVLLSLSGCVTDQSLKEQDCRNQAEDRMDLYNKPDFSPLSELDRKAAETALFNKCMSTNAGYQDEVDTRNSLNSMPIPVNALPAYGAGGITMTDQPPLAPVPAARLQPYASPNKELLDMLTRN